MIKLTTLNTKLLAAAIAAAAALALFAVVEVAPWTEKAPVARLPGASGAPEEGLLIWGTPRDLPAVQFTDASGRQVGLGAFRGKAVLVNFWATWCEPCKREMPSLLRLQKRLAGKDFAVLAVSGDRGGKADAEPYLAKNGLAALDVLYDPMLTSARRLGIDRLPTTLLLGPKGRELARAEGAIAWDSDAVVEKIEGAIPAAGTAAR